MRNKEQKIEIVRKVLDELVYSGKRHRVIVGGRGKGASWSIARVLLTEGIAQPLFIPCVREVQKTIRYSVKRLLDATIQTLDLDWFYSSNDNEIRGINGTLFAFFGLHDYNADNIKSLEGADRCWVAEAQSLSRNSINVLRPTIRKQGSVIWWDFNPRYETDPVYVDYIRNKDTNAAVLWLNWRDNEWFPDTLAKERDSDYNRDEEEAKHIWEGKLRDMGERYVCPSSIVDVAISNSIGRNRSSDFVVGADIAHQGGDEIVFYMRKGKKIVNTFIGRRMRKSATLKALKAFMVDESTILNIDNGHIGAAIADDMVDEGFTVNAINFGGTPKDAEHYQDIVTEMYFELTANLPYSDIPDDEELRNQLVQRRWSFINGRRGYEVMKIESKDDFTKHAIHINKSPDRADALALCYYGIAEEKASIGFLRHNIF